MRIGYFPVMAGRQAGGVEVYEVSLLQALAAVDCENTYDIFCLDRAAADSFGIERRNFRFHILSPGPRPLAYAVLLPAEILRRRCRLLHSTYIPPLWNPARSVFTLHDTSVFDRPEFYHARHRTVLKSLQLRGLKKAHRIICDSQTTLESAARRFPWAEGRMRRVYCGLGQPVRPVDPGTARLFMASKFGVDRPYAVYAGQLRMAHKNLDGLLAAFAICRRELGDTVRLVLVGKRSWTTADLDELIERSGLGGSVVLTGHISTDELSSALSGAHMLAFPSRSEGFGLAVVEAMACGTPVVAARATSLPEIVGEAGILVDPDSPADIAAGMTRLFTDANLAGELRMRGLKRARDFTWQAAAEETLEQYTEVAR